MHLVPVNTFWRAQGLAVPRHLDYFLCVLFSLNAFYPFMHFFSCQMVLLLWQMLWLRARSLSLQHPDFVGYTGFVSYLLLLLQRAVRKVWGTWCVWAKELLFCSIVLLIAKPEVVPLETFRGYGENTTVSVACIGAVNMQINRGSLHHRLLDAGNSPLNSAVRFSPLVRAGLPAQRTPGLLR